MRINVGPSVEGENFFGRHKELERIADIWQNHATGIFIPGPRRIGKTSLVKEFMRRNHRHYKFIYFDLEGRYSIIELCKDLMKEIESSFPGLIKRKDKSIEKWNTLNKMLSEIEIGGILKIKTGELTQTTKDFIDRMDDVFDLLYNENFIIAFDEFSDFLLNLKKSNNDEVKFFLEWMRRLRHERKLRLMITGSINIISTIEELNFLYLINDMTDIEILPLQREEIRSLSTELLKVKKITLSREALDFVEERLGDGIPFYVQLFADGLAYYGGGNRTIYNLDEIKDLYKRITDKTHKEFLDLHNRLKNHLQSAEYNAATKILAHCCQSPMGFDDIYPFLENILPEKLAVNKILKRLTDEGYLKKENGKYGFVSILLADWWKNHYEYER
ncbi:MAG: ATP-binding protein [Candidatus Omnitrophota bacterium]